MVVVPVLDLSAGNVVHAIKGERECYQPIESAITASIEPRGVVSDILNFYPFEIVYLADLDAIGGNANHIELIQSLASDFPHLTFWLDGGFCKQEDLDCYLELDNVRYIVGTEMFANLDEFHQLLTAIPNTSQAILSLDYRAGQPMGPPEIYTTNELWPDRVIVMHLDYVGAGNGPDWDLLSRIYRLANGRDIIAGGGIRHRADLQRLSNAGINHALIASALHNGVITPADIASV